MKKLMALALAFILALSCLSFIACGGGEKKEEITTETPAETSAPEEVTKEETHAGGLNWGDVPIYSGAKRRESAGDIVVEETKKQFRKVEERLYVVDDPPEKVASFYQKEMPKKGWKKGSEVDIGGGSTYSEWLKDGGNKGVVISTTKRIAGGQTSLDILKFEGRK